MTERDYSKRVTDFYDDRDGDTVTSLEHPVIKVCDAKTPKMVLFLVADKKSDAKGPIVNLVLEAYVRMMDIPEPLKTQVREALGLTKKP